MPTGSTKKLDKIITGDDLRIARIIYGFDSQDALAQELKCSLGTVQRYEAADEVDAKVIGVYTVDLNFDLSAVIASVAKLRLERKNRG